MKYASSEDRLNPVPPEDADDTTLGGYAAHYGRVPAFEGSDGEPYTAGIETDTTGDPDAPFSGYLVFVRWAQTGTAVMGHLETPDLVTAPSEEEARRMLEEMTLARVRAVLDETIARKRAESSDA